YNMGDAAAFKAYFEGVGLDNVEVKTHVGRARFASIQEWVYTDVKGWVMSEAFGDAEFELLLKEAETALVGYADASGRVEFDAPAHIMSARKVV
ncbi:MAG: hypothetical protein AAF633_22830, partial [Chloroflexota bacterium]